MLAAFVRSTLLALALCAASTATAQSASSHAIDIPRIVSHSRGSSMKTNPVMLEDNEIMQIIEMRL